ncbi:MAG: trypsin-like peptidase domain-containing protein [Lachnospiraceae bacterium]|nr:trypsin-like peptidase domain-containing protein [Lachnospiraceae bacterium]
MRNKDKRPNAWKRYGAIAMAGVVLLGASAVSGKNYPASVQAEETETRITLNMADDDSSDTKNTASEETETETETEKRITLNVADDEKPGSEEETEAKTELAAEAETDDETETEVQTETETKETYASIEGAKSVSDGIVTTDVSAVVENCMPSIVAITGKSVEDIETYYYGTQEYEAESAASGIIIAQNDDELLIATNSHVVADTSDLNVCFSAEADDTDDLVAPAKIKGMDKDNELAVIAVQLSDIPEAVRSQLRIAKIGDSDALKVGQAAIAIGNALGYGQSVTSGIISALNREITIDNFSKPVIMTDAAINFGNSGGALLNANGEVIGINVAKEAGQSSESMGYSIPINTAVPILKELVNRETRDKLSNSERGYIGATVVDVSDDAKDLYDMPQGAFVYEVSEGSAAEQAGIHKGDIITKFEGISVTDKEDLIDQMSYYKVGETVTLEVQSATNGSYEAREVEVTLQQGAASATDDFGQSQQPDGSDSWGNQDDQGELPENPFADGGLYEGNGTF